MQFKNVYKPSVKKFKSFFQSDEHKDIYELKIVVGPEGVKHWIERGFVMHQINPGEFVLMYRNTYWNCAPKFREIDKYL